MAEKNLETLTWNFMQGMYPEMRNQNGQAVGCIECYLYKDLISDSEYGF